LLAVAGLPEDFGELAAGVDVAGAGFDGFGEQAAGFVGLATLHRGDGVAGKFAAGRHGVGHYLLPMAELGASERRGNRDGTQEKNGARATR
jgi:hypothetical protein